MENPKNTENIEVKKKFLDGYFQGIKNAEKLGNLFSQLEYFQSNLQKIDM